METEYRIPTIDEFVQGFEFEYLDVRSYRFVILDFSSNELCDFSKFPQTKWEEWRSKKVDWKFPDDACIIEEHDNITIGWMGSTYNWMNSWYHRDIQKLIDDGKVRSRV